MTVYLLALLAAVASACNPRPECVHTFRSKANDLMSVDFTPSWCKDRDIMFKVQAPDLELTYYIQLCRPVIESCTTVLHPPSVLQVVHGPGGEDCASLGQGAPSYTPWDGGVNITFLSSTIDEGQALVCPIDPILDLPRPRRALLVLECDETIDDVEMSSVIEGPTCFYTMHGRSSMACSKPACTA